MIRTIRTYKLKQMFTVTFERQRVHVYVRRSMCKCQNKNEAMENFGFWSTDGVCIARDFVIPIDLNQK